MSKFNSEYYYMSGEDTDDIPLFRINDEVMNDIQLQRLASLAKGKPASPDIYLPMELDLYNNNYRLTDYHEAPEPILIKRVKELIDGLNIFGLQFLSTELEIGNKQNIDNYFYLHIYNFISCIDKKNSVIEWFDDDDFILEAISLDDDVLNKIPLGKRLAFRLNESTTDYIVHKSFVDSLKSFQIDGIEFISVSERLSQERN